MTFGDPTTYNFIAFVYRFSYTIYRSWLITPHPWGAVALVQAVQSHQGIIWVAVAQHPRYNCIRLEIKCKRRLIALNASKMLLWAILLITSRQWRCHGVNWSRNVQLRALFWNKDLGLSTHRLLGQRGACFIQTRSCLLGEMSGEVTQIREKLTLKWLLVCFVVFVCANC